VEKTGLVPKLIQLTGYINYLKAGEEETLWASKYKKNGWKLLNRKATGGLAFRNSFYTKERCKEILLSYEYQRDIVKDHSNLLNLCKVHGWHSNIIRKLKLKAKRNNHWNKEECAKVIKTVSSVGELIKKNRSMYNAICHNRWKDELIGHLKGSIKSHGYWTKERCKEAALKSTSRSEFGRSFSQAYILSRKNKWIEEFFPNPKNTTFNKK